MNFIEAVKECDKGNKVILESEGGTLLVVYKGVGEWREETLRIDMGDCSARYNPLIEDILSDKWEVLE